MKMAMFSVNTGLRDDNVADYPWLCFALVVFGVVVGLLVIIGAGTGKVVSFEHGWPTLVPKS